MAIRTIHVGAWNRARSHLGVMTGSEDFEPVALVDVNEEFMAQGLDLADLGADAAHTSLTEALDRHDFRRILTEPENSLIIQYTALLATEDIVLDFHEVAIDALADLAAKINETVENIGARRLHTVMEKLLEDISFTAPDRSGDTVVIDAAFVEERVGDLARNTDLGRFIL